MIFPKVNFFVPRPRSSGSCRPERVSEALSRPVAVVPFILALGFGWGKQNRIVSSNEAMLAITARRGELSCRRRV